MKRICIETATIVACVLLIAGCRSGNDLHQEAQLNPQESKVAPLRLPSVSVHEGIVTLYPPPLLCDENSHDIQFKFQMSKPQFVQGEPIIVTVHAVNPSGKDIQIVPGGRYPSLMDFGIWHYDQPLMYSVNMAMNMSRKSITVPANSRILYTKENVLANTMANSGKRFSLGDPGDHKLIFRCRKTWHVIDFTIEESDKKPNKAIDGD